VRSGHRCWNLAISDRRLDGTPAAWPPGPWERTVFRGRPDRTLL